MSPIVTLILTLIQTLIGIVAKAWADKDRTHEQIQADLDVAWSEFSAARTGLRAKLDADDKKIDDQLK